MSDCSITERVLSSWVDSEGTEPQDRRLLEDHLAGCPACAARARGVLLLAERDAGGRDVLRTDGGPRPGFDGRVMLAVGAASGRRRSGPRPVVFRLAAVAAALLVFVAGGLVAYRAGWVRDGRAGPDTLVVRFELAAPGARSVFLVGDFTDWKEGEIALVDRNGDGLWEITVPLRRGRAYTYNFLIDGEQWVVDPQATTNVDDGFGGSSSVMAL